MEQPHHQATFGISAGDYQHLELNALAQHAQCNLASDSGTAQLNLTGGHSGPVTASNLQSFPPELPPAVPPKSKKRKRLRDWEEAETSALLERVNLPEFRYQKRKQDYMKWDAIAAEIRHELGSDPAVISGKRCNERMKTLKGCYEKVTTEKREVGVTEEEWRKSKGMTLDWWYDAIGAYCGPRKGKVKPRKEKVKPRKGKVKDRTPATRTFVHRNLHRATAVMMSRSEESRLRYGCTGLATTALTASANIPLLEDVPTISRTVILTQLQFHVVDLLSRIAALSCARKRRRRPLDPIFPPPSPRPFHEDSSERPGPFRGIRYRRDHGRWVAVMRHRHNRVCVGDFHSEAAAARAVDAAHYYYGKTERLNFADAPQLLSARPAPVASLTEAEMRWFVMKEGKWLASMACARPFRSSPSVRASLEIVESFVGHVAATFEHRSFSEIANDSGDDVRDAFSQLQDSNLMPESDANGVQTMDRGMGAAMVSPVLDNFPVASETENMDTTSGCQMLPRFLQWSPSPVQDSLVWSPSRAPMLQMDDWQGNVEGLPSQENEEMCRLWYWT